MAQLAAYFGPNLVFSYKPSHTMNATGLARITKICANPRAPIRCVARSTIRLAPQD
jgi:hypothetical protein